VFCPNAAMVNTNTITISSQGEKATFLDISLLLWKVLQESKVKIAIYREALTVK
jgi:hypothetical protein